MQRLCTVAQGQLPKEGYQEVRRCDASDCSKGPTWVVHVEVWDGGFAVVAVCLLAGATRNSMVHRYVHHLALAQEGESMG